jgi:hypothetical protein
LLGAPTLLALLLQSPSDVPTCTIVRLPEGVKPPRIDGRLDDEAWKRAAVIDGLTQVEPDMGAPGSEKTQVLLLYDARTIWVGLRCFDSDPAGIRATQSMRDAVLDPDDRVEIWFDTFHDHRNAFWFQIGAAGGPGDALIARNGASFNKQWDGIWEARSRVTAQGWEAEIAIPLQTISFDPERPDWGMNVVRWIRRKNEEDHWASADPRLSFYAMAYGGTLTGFHDLQKSLGLDVVPFVTVDRVRRRTEDRDYLQGDGGFDLFWRVTPNFKFSGSFNTDFAETEVDSREVNLTRFPLFFPEKRDFFLEDSGNFTFGSSARMFSTPELLPFFSRRIGLDANGAEVPLLGAMKFTGRTDDVSIGVLDVVSDAHDDVARQNLFAGRFSKNLFAESDAGVIVTSGDPDGGGRALTYGADFNWRASDFLGDRNLRFSSYLLKSAHAGAGGDGLAFQSLLAYPNDTVDANASYTLIQQDFDPALGFVLRSDVKKYAGTFHWKPRPHDGSVRQWDFGIDPALYTGLDNRTQSSSVKLTPAGVELESGDRADVTVTNHYEHLDEDFEIVDGVVLPPGGYRFTQVGGEINTSEARPLSVDLLADTGSYWDGKAWSTTLAVGWRPCRWGNVGLVWQRTDANLDEGSFVARVTRLRLNLVFTPELSWTTLLQYDNLSHEIGLFSRVWWIFRPGCETFLVLNQGWLHDPRATTPLDTQLTLKVGWTFRY